MRRIVLPVVLLAAAALGAIPAAAQENIDCGTYRDLVCEGYFTDEPRIATDHQRIEDNVARVNDQHGNPFALVVVDDSRGDSPASFATDLANAWGVGDPVDEAGILVLVSLD